MKVLFLIVLALAILGSGTYFTYEMFVRPKLALQHETSQLPPAPPPDPTLIEYAKVQSVLQLGNFLESRLALADFVGRYPDSSKVDEAKEQLGKINIEIFLSNRSAPEKVVYVVRPGDVLTRVAAKLSVTPELLMRANNLHQNMLRTGQRLAVSPAEFSVKINREKKLVTLYNQDRFFKQYPIHAWTNSMNKGGHPATPHQKQVGKVRDKVALVAGHRVTFADKSYWDAKFWIETTLSGCTLFPDPDENAKDAPNAKPTNGGISLAPEDLTELGALLSKDDPVTLD